METLLIVLGKFIAGFFSNAVLQKIRFKEKQIKEKNCAFSLLVKTWLEMRDYLLHENYLNKYVYDKFYKKALSHIALIFELRR